MAISKRLRYEILRRDNHTCRYCGGVAPEVVLRVDHVVPQALGGSDEPSNLVAACHDCNAGKTSSAPDQHVVEDVGQKALRWSFAIAQAAKEMASQSAGRTELYDAIRGAFPGYYQRRLPKDLATTADQLINAGLPVTVIVDMAKLAAVKPNIDDRWKYFCGCCWTKIRQLQDRALEIADDQDESSGSANVMYELTTSVADTDLELSTALAFYEQLRYPIPPEYWDCLCPRSVRWVFKEVVEDEDSYPCDDPICVAQYGQYVQDEVVHQRRYELRVDAVMDAADELELAH